MLPMKSRSDGIMGKVERKTVEKNRRIHMKSLCMKLASLIPKEHAANPMDMLSQQDHLDQATSYIKTLQEKIDRMKHRRNPTTSTVACTSSKDSDGGLMPEFRLPVVQVRHQDSNLEVVLVSGLQKKFVFHEVIGVLEEEGAEVVNANFSVVGEKIFHTIHSQAMSSRLGLDSSRVTERLKQLIR